MMYQPSGNVPSSSPHVITHFCSCCKFKNWCHDSCVRWLRPIPKFAVGENQGFGYEETRGTSKALKEKRNGYSDGSSDSSAKAEGRDCCDFSITLSVVIQALLHSGRRYPHGKDFCIFPFFSERKDSEERRKVKTTFAFALTRRVIQR